MIQNKIKLLVVEDNPKDAVDLGEMLDAGKKDAYAIESADRLAAAYRKIAGDSFDLIILDLFLPESKGIGTLKKVKAKAPGTPIVALTRFDDELTGANAVREGAQDYLVKGQFDSNLLDRSIHHAIERHRGEEAIRLKNIELEVLNKKLQEADRLKSVFLANMSHELRTPLNSIIGFTSIILKGMSGPITQEHEKQLSMVKNNGEHLLQLINEVLDVSKIEAGKIELEFKEFSLGDLIDEIVVGFAPAVNKKDLSMVTRLEADVKMSTDRVRLKQILMNLTINAVKFTDEGSVTISSRDVPGDQVALSIDDTGIGIREEDMPMLYTPFHQLDMSMTKKYQGTGLGLHLSQKLARLLGGQIQAQSVHGKGSCFTLTIPRKHEEAAQ